MHSRTVQSISITLFLFIVFNFTIGDIRRAMPTWRATIGAEDDPDAPRYHRPPNPGMAHGSCASCRPVTLVYLKGPFPGLIDDAYVEHLARQLREAYGLTVTVHPPTTMPPGALDTSRQQFDASKITKHMLARAVARHSGATKTRARPVHLALTNQDLFFSDMPDWSWAFGGRRVEDGHAVGVISAYRMAGAAQRRRALIMLGKYIATMSCGAPTSSDRQSITYHGIRAASDLDRMDAIICTPSRPQVAP